jgi:hypothetical protein
MSLRGGGVKRFWPSAADMMSVQRREEADGRLRLPRASHLVPTLTACAAFTRKAVSCYLMY